MNETNISMDSIRLFVSVAERCNFRAAARELSMPVATLSRKIVALEEGLGVKLFERTNRQVRLTPAGKHLLSQVRMPLSEMSNAIHLARELQDDLSGVVKIATTETMAETNILPILSDLYRQYPKITVELVLNENIQDVRFSEVDFAIRGGRVVDESLVGRKIAEHHFQRFVSTNVTNPETLPIIAFDRAFEPDQSIWLTINSIPIIKRMVMNGQGQAYLLRQTCKAELDAGQIRCCDGFPVYQFDIFLVYPSRMFIRKAVRVVMDAVEDFASQTAD